MYYIIGALALGVGAGMFATFCWDRFIPKGFNRTFLIDFSAYTGLLVRAEGNSEFLLVYKSLVGLVWSYVLCNMFAILSSVGSVALLIYVVVIPLEEHASRRHGFVGVFATQPVTVIVDGESISSETITVPHIANEELTLQVNGTIVPIHDVKAGVAISGGIFNYLLMSSLVCDVTAMDVEDGFYGTVIVRPLFANRNPFWPYLTDVSFSFYIGLLVGSVLVRYGISIPFRASNIS